MPGAILAPRVQLLYDGGVAVTRPPSIPLPSWSATLPQLTVGASPNPGVPGTRLLYTATLTDTSAGAVNGIGLLLRTPAGIQYVYSTDAEPNGWAF